MKGLNQLIRNNVPEILIDYFDFFMFTAVFVWIASKLLPVLFLRRKKAAMLEKWSTSPKDVVILHSVPRGFTVPDISPFALKLETFLKMAKIPYQFDDEFPFGDKQKTPWITLNGKHLADSQIIVEFLSKKFDVKLGNYNDEQLAQARAIRIMIEEHIYWGGVVWRFSYCDPSVLQKLYSPLMNKFNWLIRPIIWKSIIAKFNQMAWAQGTGRHSYEEIVSMMSDSMRALSLLLGNKKFILGDEPCADDSAIFGLVAQGLWASPGAPFHEVFKECPNLEAYSIRMKDKFWPDWDQYLAKQN